MRCCGSLFGIECLVDLFSGWVEVFGSSVVSQLVEEWWLFYVVVICVCWWVVVTVVVGDEEQLFWFLDELDLIDGDCEIIAL